MKADKNISDKELFNYLSAIASGILTNVIYDELFPYYYEKIESSNSIMFIQIEQFNFFEKILIIMTIFFVVWFLLSVIIPFIIKKIKDLSYKKRKVYSKKDIMTNYNNINKNVQKLIESNIIILSDENFKYNNTVLASEISNNINNLYKIFCPSKNAQKRIVKSAFRQGNTINDIGKYISHYEFEALLNNIEIIFNSIFQENTNALKENDYNLLKEKIKELKLLNID